MAGGWRWREGGREGGKEGGREGAKIGKYPHGKATTRVIYS